MDRNNIIFSFFVNRNYKIGNKHYISGHSVIYYTKERRRGSCLKSKKNSMRTYIHGNISQRERETVQSHMDYLGFDSSQQPGEYRFESRQYWYQISGRTDVLSSANQLPMHSHTWMEIFRYTSDSRIEYLIGTRRYLLQKGDIICIPPGVCHQVLRYDPPDIPCVRDLIVVQSGFLSLIDWNSQPGEYYLLRTTDTMQKQMGELCEMCVRESIEQKPHWRDMVSGCVRILLTQILRHADLSIKAEADGLFEKILTHIDGSLDQKLTLSDTAKIMFTSERTITREFQKNLGISFHRYVTQRRMLIAGNLIRSGVPLEAVCQRVGYADYPTFYRAFKKEYDMSPRQMQQAEYAG